MKITSFIGFAAILAFFTLSVLSSCDKGKLPNIAFKSGGKYVTGDKTVAKGDTVQVGLTASKAESSDILKTFSETVSFDGASATSVLNESLTGSQNDAYDKDVQIIARKQNGTEKYTFTVVNRDGLTNSVSLTLTVQ